MTTSNEVFYTVELTSRFSGFLDDPLSAEDPTILLSKIQNERAEKRKEKFSQARERKISQKSDVGVPDAPLASETANPDTTPIVSTESAEAKQQFQGPSARGRGRGRAAFRGYPRVPRDARPMNRPLTTSDE